MSRDLEDASSSYFGDDPQPDKNGEGVSTLYVCGISDSVTEDTLKNIFGRIGEVQEIRFKQGNRFSHIKYSNVREAEMAVRQLNNQPPYNLRIEFARIYEKKPSRGGPNVKEDPPLTMTKFTVEPLKSPVLSRGRGKRLLASTSHSDDCCDDEPAPPIPGIKVLQSVPYYNGGSVVMRGRGHYLPSSERGSDYSVPPLPQGFFLAEDGPLQGSCRCCHAQTDNACSDCRVFYCSTNCMTIHADVHMSFCKKLKPTREIVGGGSRRHSVGLAVMENSRFQTNAGRSRNSLGFPTRFLIDEKKQNSGPVTSNAALLSSCASLMSEKPNSCGNYEGHPSPGQSGKNHQVKQNDQGSFYQRSQKTDVGGYNSQKFHRNENTSSSFHQRSQETDVGGHNAQKFRRGENTSFSFREPKKFESNGNSQPGKIYNKGDQRKFHQNDGGNDRSSSSGRRNDQPKFGQNDSGRYLPQEGRRDGMAGRHKGVQNSTPRYGEESQKPQKWNGEKDEQTVVCLWAEEDGFWVVPLEKHNLWQSINTELKRDALKLLPIKPCEDLLCAAKFEGDWFRARVISLNPLTVHYIDYGNKSPYNELELKELPKKLADIPQMARFVKVMDGAQLKVNENTSIRFVKTEQDVEWVQLAGFPKNVPLKPRSAPMEDSRGNKERDRVGDPRTEGTKEIKVSENGRGDKQLTLNIPNSHPKTDSHKTQTPEAGPSNRVPTTSATSSSKPPNKAQLSSPKPVKSIPLPSVLEELKVGSKEICIVNAIEGSKALVTLAVDLEVNNRTLKIFELDCSDSEPTVAGVGCLAAVKMFGNELAVNNWARGCIIASSGGKDTVALVDYGSKLLVDAVYPLPKDMLTSPTLACVLESSDMSCLKVGVEFEVLVVEEVKGGWLCQLQSNVEEGATEVVANCMGTFLPWELQPNDVESSELQAFESGTRVNIVSALGISRLYVISLNQEYVEIYGDIYDQVAIAAAGAPAMSKLPPVGDLVAAKFRGDDVFYRAKVISHRGEEVQVKFIDFGNTQVTPLSEIKALPENFRKVPGAAAYITLSNVPDVTSEEALALVNDAILKATAFVLTHDGNLSNGVTLTNAVSNVEFNATLKEVAEQIPKEAKVIIEDLEDEIRVVKLEVGPAVDVLVVYAEEKELFRAGKLYCSPAVSDEVNYVRSELTKDLNEHCQKLPNVRYRPRPSEICAAVYDGEWARGLCLKDVGPSSVEIFFLDYGNTEVVDTGDIRKAIKKFKTPAACVVECFIEGIEKAKTDATRKQVIEAVGGILEQKITVAVSRKDDESYFIKIPNVEAILLS